MAIAAYSTKNGRRYRVELYRDGVRVAGKTGFATKKEARAWQQQAEADLQGQELTTRLDFFQLATLYLEDMKARRQPNTWQYKFTTLQRFLTFMGGRFPLKKLTPRDVDAYLRARFYSHGPKAANRDIVELKAAVNWMLRKQLFAGQNLFAMTERFAENAFKRHVPTREHIDAVLVVASQEQKDFLHILLHTGARLSEVCSLNWEDVNFKDNTITLWTRKRSGGNREARTLAMSQTLRATLEDRSGREGRHETFVFVGRDNKQFTKNSVRLWLPELCKAAEVKPPFTAHGLRHFVATRLMDSGRVTSFQVQNFLGHKNLSTTEKYLHELRIDRGMAEILDE